MKELWTFRVKEEYAHILFAPQEGKRIDDSQRDVVLPPTDPRFTKVGELDEHFMREENKSFFGWWDVRFQYSAAELSAAELFELKFGAYFEPTGEECGTKFDYSDACKKCGMPRHQVGQLVLDLRKTPKSKDIACTIADDEWIVTQRLAEILVDAKFTGFDLQRVQHKARYRDDAVDFTKTPSGREIIRKARKANAPYPTAEFGKWLNRPEQNVLVEQAFAEYESQQTVRAQKRGMPPPVWYQIVVTSEPVSIVPPTRAGNGPFDDDPEGRYRCSKGHVLGLNLLSEIRVSRDEWSGSDLCRTKQLIGTPFTLGEPRGVRVPAPLLLMSPRFRAVLLQHKIKGWSSNVAYLK